MSSPRKVDRRRCLSLETLEDRRLMAVDAGTEPFPEAITAVAEPSVEVAHVSPPLAPHAIAVASDRGSSSSGNGARADVRASTSLKLVGDVPGGLRGDRTTFTVLLRDASGTPLAGQRVDFSHRYGGRDRDIGSDTTDGSGYATLSYRIPPDPSADNISLTATFDGTSRYKASSCTVGHVEIGRKSPEVDVSGPAAGVNEGSVAVFTFRLSQSAKAPVTVTYATVDGSATAGSDYVGASGSITFAPGETAKKVAVATLVDAVADPDEAFSMRIVSVTGARQGSPTSSTATIRDTSPPPPVTTGSWTVFVYIAGSNLNTYANQDVNEMEKALGSLPAGVRIVVSWDQPSGGDSYATGNRSQAAWGTYGRSVLSADADMSSIASRFDLSCGERNTGDPATLVDFVKWGVERAPAQRYMLQMWGHGYGFLGAQTDPEANDDSLTIGEMATALGAPGMPRMSLVAYDSCLMGMAEVGTAIAPLVSGVFVASEELISGNGQDYTTAYARLNVADPAKVTAEQLAAGMVAGFQRQYQGTDSRNDTLSAIATAGYADLNRALAEFVTACGGLGPRQRDAMISAAKASPAFGEKYGFTNADLGVFMAKIEASPVLPLAVREAASRVTGAVASMVTSKTTDPRGTGGIAVFLPTDVTKANLADYTAHASVFCQATGWDRFARWLATGAGMSNSASVATGQVTSRLDGISVSITTAAWAAYAMEAGSKADTESPASVRRSRV